ncbi:hypothetical protein FJT64_020017 [Amphibalanus amphitrite]|uniref:Uncharacterized protein n=1 Tax=Amphibalanus amphitrite TaxID=1232801 RepID=A0A6A4X326_AMPAM|nr:hypothetical protein FJT64_020017 [Amphibalanus amphitrite]
MASPEDVIEYAPVGPETVPRCHRRRVSEFSQFSELDSDDGPPPSPRIGDDDPSPRAPLPRIGDDDPSLRTLSSRIGDDDPSPRAPSPRIGDDDPSPRAGDGGGPAGDGGGPAGDGGGPPSPRAGDDARPLDSGPPPSLVGGSPSPALVGDGRPPPPPRAGDGGGPPSPRAGDGGPPPPTSLRLAGGDPLEGSVEREDLALCGPRRVMATADGCDLIRICRVHRRTWQLWSPSGHGHGRRV